VIKLDIVNRVAERTGVPKMKAEQAVDALFHSMKEALARGERIELRGFGVFVVKPRKRGVGRNPRTGEEVAIPSGKTIRFKPGKELQAHGFDSEHDDHDDHDDDIHDTEPPRGEGPHAAGTDGPERPPDRF
jgi:DNA-binding protein HU-beta